MDFDDVALCYLFMQAGGGDEKEKTAEFNELEKVVKLPDWESDRLSEFKKEFKKKEVAQKKISEMLPEYAERYASSSSFSSLMKEYGIGSNDEGEERGLTVLWWFIRLSYASEKRSEFDDTFIQSFASKMKIDESYVQEMKDTKESFLLIEKKPQWAESENLSDSEMAEINRQCKEDKDVLNDSIYDLVYLG